MKRIVILAVLSFFLVSGFTGDPWKHKDLIEPSKLAQLINNGSPGHIIWNVGGTKLIKGAVAIGPASGNPGMETLKKMATGADKKKLVVIYCGCCKLNDCPNIRPAFTYLKAQGFRQVKVLNMPTNIYEDWITKGYPMQ